MARPHRDAAAGTFHVYTHGLWEGRGYFRDDLDRTIFLRELARATSKFAWTCIAYCLLGSHYHLVLDVRDGALSRGMQSLNWRYSMQFNDRHRLRGHHQFERFGSRRIEDEYDLESVYLYVARNPVEATLCEQAEHWRWSSHAGTVGLRELDSFVDPAALYDCVGGSLDVARVRLRQRVAEP